MHTLANIGDRVWYAEAMNESAIDWRGAFIAGFDGDPANGNACLCVLSWDGSTYSVIRPYSAIPTHGYWSYMADVTFS